jgi:hypothetical protein
VRLRTCIAAAVVATALLALPAAPAQAASPCGPKGAQGYAGTGSARVFAVPAGKYRRVYACLYSQNKPRFLGWDGTCGRTLVGAFGLAGPYVAYSALTCDADVTRTQVIVRNIKTGSVVRQARAATALESFPKPSDSVAQLALASSGMVAWTATVDGDSGMGTSEVFADVDAIQVRKLDQDSPKDGELVDSGLGVDRGSLALARSGATATRYYWSKDGAAATDLLAGKPQPTIPGWGASTSKCTGKGARTLGAANGKRVFSLPKNGERRVYACLVSKNKPRFLGLESECQDQAAASGFKFAGHLVAYVESNCPGSSVSATIAVIDMERGGIRRYVAVEGAEPAGPSSRVSVTGLDISATSGLVWIGGYDADGTGGIGNVPGDSIQVRKLDPGATPVTVDSGTAIDRASLALGPYHGFNSFYWLKSGAPVSGVLAGN